GIVVMIGTDPNGRQALRAGLSACGLADRVQVAVLPTDDDPDLYAGYFECWDQDPGRAYPVPTHYVAVERVGPSHMPESLAAQGATADVLRRFREEVPEAHH